MSIRYPFYLFTYFIIVLCPGLLNAMEDTEHDKELTASTKIISAISFYHYDRDDRGIENVTEEQTEEFTTPFTYSIEEHNAGGFSLPKEYSGKAVVEGVDKTEYLALFYALMHNKEQFLSIIHARDKKSLCTILQFIINEKVDRNRVESFKLCATNGPVTRDDYGLPDADDPRSKLIKSIDPTHTVRCDNTTLFFNESKRWK